MSIKIFRVYFSFTFKFNENNNAFKMWFGEEGGWQEHFSWRGIWCLILVESDSEKEELDKKGIEKK